MGPKLHLFMSLVLVAVAFGVFSFRSALLVPPAPSREFVDSVASASLNSVSLQQSAAYSVYLIGSPSADVLTPDRLQAELSLDFAADWQDVLDLHALSPIEILIVDPGSFALVDWQWVADRSDQRIIVAGINLSVSSITTVIPSPSLQQFLVEMADIPNPPPHPGDRASLLAMHEEGSGDSYYGISDEFVNNPQTLAMGLPGDLFFRRLGLHLQNLEGE